ncbi:nucleoside-specific channel-forming Tsx family protein [Aliivibrio fischeri]|uniref:Ion channel protein Tsx n=1 Tax=Aliivibrio fischeri TaxID=668 RepID=A0A510UHB3_ALIFS|nr:outer membrane protein OmpK [Aliivibrio fischeri]MUK64705.1 hypothetical protein [Aliivibrio fischeri]GEK14028.1 hypothetical protein AFI02nite_20640 [Aliivibrio fischeri]
MRKSLLALSVLATTVAIPAQAENLYTWGNMNINYLDWSNSSNDGGKDDFAYLEFEGGAGFDWGELYGFLDLEGQKDSMAASSKGSIAYKTGLGELRLYGQTYSTENLGWHVRNTVAGVSYNFSGEQWFFNPFIGAHYTNTNGFSDMNGGMAGWVTGYNFNLGEQSFSISNWNEMEFARDSAYTALSGETDDISFNGAVAFWWNATKHITTGIQYRYADNKLGQGDLDDAIIYTLKYNF